MRVTLRLGLLCCVALTCLWTASCQNETAGGEAAPDQGDAEALDDAGDAGQADVEPTPVAPVMSGVAPFTDINPDPAVVEVDLVADEVDHPLTDDFSLPLWAYNGSVPGPMLEANVGDEVVVHFTNQLDQATTIHWHGLRVPDSMDGNPRIQDPVEPGETFTYRFIVPDAGTFWYHPHVRSNEQVERGLYGPIVVHGEADPSYDAERIVVLDDALIDGDEIAPFLENHMEGMHGRFGNVLLVNGRIDPVAAQASQGAVERWRLVNAANARTLELTVDGARFRVIGTDGGLLREPYAAERIWIASGQRYDLEVSYDQAAPAALTAHVDVLDENDQVVSAPFPLLEVDLEATGDTPRAVTLPVPEWAERPIDREETLVVDAVNTADGGLEWRLNGQAHAMEPLFTFRQGDTVRLTLVNDLGPYHPIHIHGQFFEIIDDGRALTDFPGLKDTVLVPGGSTLDIRVYFDNPGQWMVHCHILEHAELGMMGEFVVEPAE